MAMTSCEVFADIGFPMDARVRLDFGFTDREPARASYREHPDGFLEGKISNDAYWQSEIPDAPKPYFHPAPRPQPVGDTASARLNFKPLDRAIKVPFNRPAPGTVSERKPSHVFVPKSEPKVQSHSQSEDQVRAERMANLRREMLVKRADMGLFLNLDQYSEIFALFGDYKKFAKSLKS
jgi:hypothetical protein